MANPEITTEPQARAAIEKDTRDFLEAFQYQKELGVFSTTWRIYRDLPLHMFDRAVPREDRMVLPGMALTVDVTHIAIQAFGGVWAELLKGGAAYTERKLHNLVRDRALTSGAPRKLAKQLADFFINRFDKQGRTT